MAATQGFEFFVEGVDGVPFATYGTKSLGRRIVSTKIQAKNGVRFQIRVKPKFPFPQPKDESDSQSRYNLRSSTRQAGAVYGRDAKDYESSDAVAKTRDPICYVAYVYIDGSGKAECTKVIVVDPESSEYDSKGYLLDGRYSLADDTETETSLDQDLTANMSISPWVFTEKGIDVLMDRMDISKEDADIPSTAMEQDLVDLTQAMADDNLCGAAKGKRGEIEVRIIRVVYAGEARPDQSWKRDGKEGPGGDDDNTHDVAIDEDGERHARMVSIRYRRYRADELFLCKAIFQYMDIAKLVNLGLCYANGEPTGHRRGKVDGGPASQLGPLKRARAREPEQSKSCKSELDKSASSEEEDSSDDTTSDSDTPRRKRRGAIRRRKAMTLNKMKTVGWKGPATVNSSANRPGLVAKIEGAAEGSDRLQLEPAAKHEGSEAVRADIGEDAVAERDLGTANMD